MNTLLTLTLRWPKLVIGLGLALIAACAAWLPAMQRDISTDAFVKSDHQARALRDHIKQYYGLGDANVIALIAPDTVYNAGSLAIIQQLSDEVANLPSAAADGVTSLATEYDIHGTSDELLVTPLLESADLPRAMQRLTPFQGYLVSHDASAALIIVEAVTEAEKEALFHEITALKQQWHQADRLAGHRLLISGEGAATGYLGTHIDEDARVMQPLSLLIMLVVMWLAFRTLRALGIALVVITATNIGTMGLMSATGTPYYLITGALPAVLMGISIADTVYILSAYYRRAAEGATDTKRLAQESVHEVWRPIVLTSITTVMGFTGIALTSSMPPMVAFGWLAGAGVLLALVFSLTVVPAILSLLPVSSSPLIGPRNADQDWLSKRTRALGDWVARHPFKPLWAAATVALAATWAASAIQVDYSLQTNFDPNEPLVIADAEINNRFNGTNFLDVEIVAQQPEQLLSPEVLTKLYEFQRYAQAQPHIGGVYSYIDDLALLQRALTHGQDQPVLPTTAAAASQYLLLFSAQASADELQNRLDYDYQRALVRVMFDTSQISKTGPVVADLEHWLLSELDPLGVHARMGGRVALDIAWMAPLASNHLTSVLTALTLVLLVSALLFRSITAGIATLVPVLTAVVTVYGAMGLFNIWLEPATAMFAAIAIGLGVDFAIHLLDRIKEALTVSTWQQAVADVYAGTGRALVINFGVLALGFSSLLVSELPVHDRFGLLVALALCGALLGTLMMVPGLLQITGQAGVTTIRSGVAAPIQPAVEP